MSLVGKVIYFCPNEDCGYRNETIYTPKTCPVCGTEYNHFGWNTHLGLDLSHIIQEVQEEYSEIQVKDLPVAKMEQFSEIGKVLSDSINHQIAKYAEKGMIQTNDISDGYHTFGELYDHRIALYIALAKFVNEAEENERIERTVWRSNLHSDGSSYEDWFLLGIGMEKGQQVTYHIPMSYYSKCNFAKTLDKAPEWDGHTAADVLERLKKF